MPSELDDRFLEDLKARVISGEITRRPKREAKKTSFYHNLYIDDKATESNRTKRQRTEKTKGKGKKKGRKKRVQLHATKGELERRKNEWVPESNDPDRMERLEAEEKAKQRRFIAPDSDSEDDTPPTLADLTKLANDFELNHGEEVDQKIAQGRERLESDRAADKAVATQQAREKLLKQRSGESTSHRELSKQVSSASTSHSNNTTNISINVNNSGATFTGAAPPDVQRQLLAMHGIVPAQPMDQALSALHMAQGGMMQPFPRSTGLDSSSSAVGLPWLPSQMNARRRPLDVLLREFVATCRGVQNSYWLNRYNAAYSLHLRGASLRRGYNSADDAIASWVAYQRSNRSILEPVKQELMDHLDL